MLNQREQSDVLRYWLALLRHEEALSARPRARRPAPVEGARVDLKQPTPGQEYLKLPREGAEAFCIAKRGQLLLEPSTEWCAFFEDWLHAQYRSSDSDDSVNQLVAFPAIHLPNDELAGLLRCSVRVAWLDADAVELRVPTYAERMRGSLPKQPAALRVAHAAAAEHEALPFFVDGRVLRDVLRIDAERLDAFFGKLRETEAMPPQRVVATLCQLLEEQLRTDDSEAPEPKAEAQATGSQRAPAARSSAEAEADVEPQVVFSRLHQLTQQRLRQLSSKARSYPLPLLIHTSRNRATFHVQRDIEAALERLHAGELAESPLSDYLAQARALPVSQALRGRFHDCQLTQSQRQVADLALGSRLCAVQGPPGTGKTTVTLNLAAHALVEHMAPLLSGHHLSTGAFLVTSTNNRAVDNVTGPLSHEVPLDRLPWALRVGSREVVDQVTTRELERAIAWLKRAKPASSEELKQAVEAHRKCVQALNAVVQPVQRRHELEAEQCLLSETLARFEAEHPDHDPAAVSEQLSRCLAEVSPEAKPDQLGPLPTLGASLRSLGERLLGLSQLTDPERRANPAKLEAHLRYTEKHQAEAVRQGLGASLDLGLPPPCPEGATHELIRELWEDAAEDALGRVMALQSALAEQSAPQQRAQQRQQVVNRLEEVSRLLLAEASAEQEEAPQGGAEQAAAAQAAACDPHHVLHRAVFESAIVLREVWARANRATLLEALGRAQQTAKRSGSLRSLLAAPRGAGVWLRRLYPVWGCTLLSLGNNFPPEPGVIARIVVDEAGQCHGAYAVAALLRAKLALVVGDVHQLEPVATLTSAEEARVLRSLQLSIGAERLLPFRMCEGRASSAQSIADGAVKERPTLIDHFRCQPAIASICERLCGYGLVAHTREASCSALLPELSTPVLIAPVAGQQERFAGSWRNERELSAVIDWTRRLLRAGLPPAELGIITPYRGQLERLWRCLAEERIPVERPNAAAPVDDGLSLFDSRPSGVAVGTVHLFQGGERRVILLSTTITERRSLGFIDDRVNLLNVAASRAREHLLTVGHVPTLQAGRHTRTLVEGARTLEA